MTPLIAAIGGGVIVLTVYLAYQRWTGCSGGHVWGQWSETDRWRISPYHERNSVGVYRERERECRREDCSATETDEKLVVDEVYANGMNGAMNAICDFETQYECPNCNEVVPNSSRETEWKARRHGKARYETCPECSVSSVYRDWRRLPFGEVVDEDGV